LCKYTKNGNQLTNLEIRRQLVHDNKEIVDAFQKKKSEFCEQRSNLMPKITFPGVPLPNSIVLNPVDGFDVKFLFDELSISKVTGNDGIPARIWK
jgi:hypothetical protein